MNAPAVEIAQKLPKGTTALVFVQLFSVISYAILYSTLALYCSQGLHLSDAFTTNLIAMFLAFNYGLHLVGGYVGGRFLSYRSLFSIGMVLIAVGCYLLATAELRMFYIGVAFFLAGSGLNVTCINCMVTQLFHPDDKQRERAFFWNYSGMNLGFCIGNIAAGYFQLHNNYRDLFLLSGIGNVLALVTVLFNWKVLKDVHTIYDASTNKIARGLFGLLLVFILLLTLFNLVQQPTISQHLVLYGGLLVFAFLLFISFNESDPVVAQKMRAYLVFAIAAIIFWSITYLIPNALILFLNRNVDRTVLNFTIPPQWFVNINPVVVVLGGLLLSQLFQWLRRNNYPISLTQQFFCALLLIGLGILLIPVGIAFAGPNGYVHSSWIVVAYILQGAAELFLGPIGFAMVGQLAPPRLRGVMMGAWLMTSGVGGALAGFFSNLATHSANGDLSPLATNPTYSHVFLILGIIGLVGAGGLLWLRPMLDRFIREPNFKAEAIS